MENKNKILFLCTGNSCRSQMAEGWTRKIWKGIIDPFSAGVESHGLNPNAVKAMNEAGVDISNHKSKTVRELREMKFDYVITVCGHADENCPVFPGKAKRLHYGFEDPPRLAANSNSKEDTMSHYRRIRDEIKRFVETLPEYIKTDIQDYPKNG